MPLYRKQEGDAERTGCKCPEGCISGEKIDMDAVKKFPEKYMEVTCSSSTCTELSFQHIACFERWENALLKEIKRCMYVREWSSKDQMRQLWNGSTAKGAGSSYYFVRASCRCACGGYLRKMHELKPIVSTQPKLKKHKGKCSKPVLQGMFENRRQTTFKRTPGIPASHCGANVSVQEFDDHSSVTSPPRQFPIGMTDPSVAVTRRSVKIAQSSVPLSTEITSFALNARTESSVCEVNVNGDDIGGGDGADDDSEGEWQVVARAIKPKPSSVKIFPKVTRRPRGVVGSGARTRRDRRRAGNRGGSTEKTSESMGPLPTVMELTNVVGQLRIVQPLNEITLGDLDDVLDDVGESDLDELRYESAILQRCSIPVARFSVDDHLRVTSLDSLFVYHNAVSIGVAFSLY